MWAQHWNNIYHLLVPFKGKENIDVTPELQKQVIYTTDSINIHFVYTVKPVHVVTSVKQ